MERQEFLKTLGISFAAVCAGSCLSACSKDDTKPTPTGTTVSAKLSDLSAIGAKVIVSGVAIFKIAEGDSASSFIATQEKCTHQGGALNWIQDAGVIRCQWHSAEFNTSGVNTIPPQGGGVATKLNTFAVTVANGNVNVAVV